MYNCTSIATRDKSESNRLRQVVKSNVHYFTTKWRNDWVIDSSAALEEEIDQYFQNETVNNQSILVKQAIKNPKQIYIDEIKNISQSFSSLFLDQNNDNFELYIEYTNGNVVWTNSIPATDDEKKELSSSYNLNKINLKSAPCSVYSSSASNKIYIPSDLGPYVVKDRPVLSNQTILPQTPLSAAIKSYPFEISTSHTKTSMADGPNKFSCSVQITADVTFNQVNDFVTREIESPEVPATAGTTKLSDTPMPLKLYPNAFKTSQESSSDQKLLKDISNPLNIYSYTGDIGQGNTFKSYRRGSKGTYVRYVQLTLLADGYKINVDGEFGAQTESIIKEFQSKNKILSDGVVDSQTKYYLGLVWSGMSQDMINVYLANIRNNDYKDRNIDVYVEKAAELTKPAATALADSTKVRLLNFTGVAEGRDPKEAVLWLAFKLPTDNYESIDSVVIKPSSQFGLKANKYDGIEVTHWRVGKSGDKFDSDLFKIKGSKPGPKKKKNNGSLIEINLGSASYKGRWIYIRVKGSSLGDAFGGAEGIAIDEISVNAQYRPVEYVEGQPKKDAVVKDIVKPNQTIPVNGVVALTYNINEITPSVKTISIDKDIVRDNGILKSLSVYEVLDTNFSSTTLPTYTNIDSKLANNTQFKPDPSRKETVNISNIISFNITNIEISPNSVREANSTSSTQYPLSIIDLVDNDNNSFNISAFSTTYTTNSPIIFNSSVQDYYLKKLTTGEVTPLKNINTVNYYDGVVLVCKQDGTPYPVNLDSNPSGQDSSNSIYYSDITINNKFGDQPGLTYGFFREDTKEFLGKSISYNMYKENPGKIYMALYAYDYDGDINTISDFTGSDQSAIIPVKIPRKVIYPVYRVKSSSPNKIQLLPMQENLTKLQPWSLMVSSGSFSKEIYLNPFAKKSWYYNYAGQTLTAKYDTSRIGSIAWSKIFGRGFYDIVNESPIIISNKSIRLRQVPIHYIHLPSSDLERFTTPFRYILNVYTRENEQSSWEKISSSLISDVNATTGIIEFKESIIPSNQNLIKVDYTIKLNGIPVKQSNGETIPINPFLSRDQVRINEPLYIYIMPSEIYKDDNLSYAENEPSGTYQKLTRVSEYTPGSVVNFTYDNNIFNKLDVVNYNPFALLIGIIYVTNNMKDEDFSLTDLRTKGGGISANFTTNKVLADIEEAVSYWDIYPALGEAYPKGGYVIIKIPNSVKKNFTNPDEVYTIIRDNLTAGVVFELQDMEGNDWGSSVTISS